MGGMKTGAGEDPFADDDPDDEPETSDDDSETIEDTEAAAGGHRSEGSGSTTRQGEHAVRSQPQDTGGSETTTDRGTDSDRMSPSDLPYIARRNASGQNVKAGRETRRLFELRPEIAELESSFMDELEGELDADVPKTDAREAALAVVYERPELVAARLEEWGVNYFEDGE